MGVAPGFSSTTTGARFGPDLGGYLLPYTWDLEGKLRNLRRPSLKGIEMPFLFLCDRED
jgi:hypothetical protein